MREHGPSKPKIGVLFVTSGWFRDVGLQGATSDTSAQIEDTARKILVRLEEFLNPVYPGVIFAVDEAGRAGQEIRAAGVDGVLLSPLMWCEDQIVRAALAELGDLPLLLWTSTPTSSLPDFVSFQTMLQGSGPVGALQLSGMLRREGRRYQPVVGSTDDEEVYRDIRTNAAAMAARRALSTCRVGVLPFPCAHMSTTFVDELGLRARYGVELKYLELERFRRTAQGVTEKQISDFRRVLGEAGVEIEVDERNLETGIRYALAMETTAAKEDLDVLAMNDVIDEMHQSFGLRPCLSNPGLTDAALMVAMEADIAAGVAMYILMKLTGQSPFYTEILNVDYPQNALLMGHAGYHDIHNRDPSLQVRVVPDVEYENSDRFSGAVSYFKYRPGPVTAVNSVWGSDGLKWMVFQGESLPGPLKLERTCHLFCRLQPEVKAFLHAAVTSGVSQHWIVIAGEYLDEIKRAGAILDIHVEAIT